MKKWFMILLTLILALTSLTPAWGEGLPGETPAEAPAAVEEAAVEESEAAPEAEDADTRMDAAVVEAEGVLPPEGEDGAMDPEQLLPREETLDIDLGSPYQGTTREDHTFQLYSDFPLTVKLVFQTNYNSEVYVYTQNGTRLFEREVVTPYGQQVTVTHTLTMTRHSSLLIKVPYKGAGAPHHADYTVMVVPETSAVVWFKEYNPLRGTPRTPLKVYGEVRSATALGYAFELISHDNDAPVPGSRVFVPTPSHTFYPETPGTYGVRMYYCYRMDGQPADEIPVWRYVDSEEIYQVRLEEGVASVTTSVADGNFIRNRIERIYATFNYVPQFSVLNVYDESNQLVHQEVSKEGQFDGFSDGTSRISYTWKPTVTGKFLVLVLAYNGETWASKNAGRWISCVEADKPHFKELTVSDGTVQVNETVHFTIESEGKAPQGSCLRIFRGDEVVASFYGAEQLKEQYAFTPTSAGKYRCGYYQQHGESWEQMAEDFFRVSNASPIVHSLNLMKYYRNERMYRRLSTWFDPEGDGDIPSLVVFSLKDLNGRTLCTTVTRTFWWDIPPVPPGTYYCEANYLRDGQWQYVISDKVTVMMQDWSEVVPQAV